MRVILADDSALLREGLAHLLEDAGCEVVGRAADAGELVRAVARDRPDVVVTDIRMPPAFSDEGLVAALEIRREHPEVGVLVLSQYLEAEYAVRLLGSENPGGVGYLLKDRVTDVAAFVDALTRVAGGQTAVDPEVIRLLIGRPRRENPLDRLTEREREVLALMAEGRSNRGIGERLFLSAKTIETHIGAILAKLPVADSPDENRRVLAVLEFLRAKTS